METLALVAALLAAIAVLILAVCSYYLVKRVRELSEAIGRSVEEELNPALRAWREAGEGAREAAGRLEAGAGCLASTLERLDRLSQKLEPDSLMRTVVGPAILKLTSWVAGFRRGMASVHGDKTEETPDE